MDDRSSAGAVVGEIVPVVADVGFRGIKRCRLPDSNGQGEVTMAGETQDQSIGPLPKFYFSVDIGDQQNLTFQEVSGLDAEMQVIEYRAGGTK